MNCVNKCTSCTAGILCECGKSKKEKSENVNHPNHYLKDSGHEVIDVVHAWKLSFNLGNVAKYIARAGKKDPKKLKEDLRKALWYLTDEIERL
mgnify:FL=1|tara:strand:+ start:434 stop:712 length:279 start_codon:yes stop_codon:yes gene_type:complete